MAEQPITKQQLATINRGLGMSLTLPKPGVIEGGLSAGIHGTESAVGGLISGLGQRTGSKGVQQYGASLTKSANKALQQDERAAPQSFSQVHGVGDALKMGAFKLLQSIPEVGAVIGGGAIAGALAPEAGLAATVAGGAAAALPLEYGSSYNELASQPGISKSAAAQGAAFEAIPKAALMSLPLEAGIGGKFASDAADGLLGRVAKSGVRGAAANTAAGAGMATAGALTAHALNPNIGVANPEFRKQLLDQLVTAPILGFATGAVGGIKAHPQPGENTTADTAAAAGGALPDGVVPNEVKSLTGPGEGPQALPHLPPPAFVTREDLKGLDLPRSMEGIHINDVDKTIADLRARLQNQIDTQVKASKKTAGIDPGELKGKTIPEIESYVSDPANSHLRFVAQQVIDGIRANAKNTDPLLANHLSELEKLHMRMANRLDEAAPSRATGGPIPQPAPEPQPTANVPAVDTQHDLTTTPSPQLEAPAPGLTPEESQFLHEFNGRIDQMDTAPGARQPDGTLAPEYASHLKHIIGTIRQRDNLTPGLRRAMLDKLTSKLRSAENPTGLQPAALPDNSFEVGTQGEVGRRGEVAKSYADKLDALRQKLTEMRDLGVDRGVMNARRAGRVGRAPVTRTLGNALPSPAYEGDRFGQVGQRGELQGRSVLAPQEAAYAKHFQQQVDALGRAKDSIDPATGQMSADYAKYLHAAGQEIANAPRISDALRSALIHTIHDKLTGPLEHGDQTRVQPKDNQPEHQVSDGRGQAAEAGGGNRTERSATRTQEATPAQEVVAHKDDPAISAAIDTKQVEEKPAKAAPKASDETAPGVHGTARQRQEIESAFASKVDSGDVWFGENERIHAKDPQGLAKAIRAAYDRKGVQVGLKRSMLGLANRLDKAEPSAPETTASTAKAAPAPSPVELPSDVANYAKARDMLANDPEADVRNLLRQSTRNIQDLLASKERLKQYHEEYGDQFQMSPERLMEAQRFINLAKMELALREADPAVAQDAAAKLDQWNNEVQRESTSGFEPQVSEQPRISGADLQNPAKREQWLKDHESEPDQTDRDLFESRAKTLRTPEEAQTLVDYARETLDTVRKIAGVEAARRTRVGTHTMAGSYDPTASIITVALNQADPVSTAAHEALHWVQQRKLSGQDRAILNRAFKPGSRERVALENRLSREPNGAELIKELNSPDEAQAYAFQYWRKGELEPKGAIGRIFNKVRQFFDRVRNFVAERGYKSWDDVFNAINAGEYADAKDIPRSSPFHPEGFKDAVVENSGVPDHLKSLFRSKVETFPNGSAFGAAHSVLYNAVENLKEHDWRSILHLGRAENLNRIVKRAWMGTVGTMYNISRHSEGFRDVFGLIQKRQHYASTLQSKFDNLMAGMIKEHDKATIDKVGRLLFEGSRQFHDVRENQFAHLDLNAPELQQVGSLSDQQLRALGANDTEIGLYHEVRGAVADIVRERAQAEAQHFYRMGYDKLAEQRVADAKHTIARGYIPHRRFGEHAVVVRRLIKGSDGKMHPDTSKDGTLAFMAFANSGGATHARDIIKQQLGDHADKFDVVYRKINPTQLFERGANLQQIMDMMDSLKIDLPQDQKAEIIKRLTAAESNARRARLRRENIPGFSKDILRTLADFSSGEARATARAVFNKQINDAVHSGKWEQDGAMGGFYQQKAMELVNDINNAGMRPDTFASKLRSAASMVYLGGSPAAGVVQLTQVPLATIPFMSQYGSITGAYAGAMRAMRDSMLPAMNDVEKLRAAVEAGKGYAKMSADEAAATLKASDEGRLYPAEIYTMMGIQQGKLFARSTAARQFIDKWMAPFQWTEQVNRRSTFLAAYRQAKRLMADEAFMQSKRGQEFASKFTGAYDYASKAVDETQGVYDKYNRPGWARHGWGGVLYTFKMFPTMMVELLSGMNPRGKATMLGTIMLASGMQGLPFANDALNAADAVGKWTGMSSLQNTQEQGRNLLRHVEQTMGLGPEWTDYLINGLADATGMNISSRLGLGDIIPGMQGLAANDFGQMTKEILGPAVGAPVQALKAVPYALHGDVLNFLKTQPVVAVKNLAKAYEGATTGAEYSQYGYKLTPVSPMQVIEQAMGASPVQTMRNFAASASLKRDLAWQKSMTQDFQQQYAAANASRDMARIQELDQSVAAWNNTYRKQPWMQIRISPQSIQSASQNVAENSRQRAFAKLPTTAQQAAETYFKQLGY